MRKTVAIFFIATLVLLSSGCAPKQDYLNNYERITQPPAQKEETTDGEIGTEEPNAEEPNAGEGPQAYEDMQWLYKPDGQGSMICTVTDVCAVKNDKDFDGNCFDYDGGIWKKDSELDFLHYPDSVDGNGDLIDGYLILVDLTLENIDARNEYLNHQTGEMVPRDGDPYIFRANDFLYLMNRSIDEDQHGQTNRKAAVYFSNIWNEEVNSMAFRLEPGETVSFKIGFLTNDILKTWSLEDDLILNTLGNGSVDGIWFPLDLEAPEA